GVSPLDPRRPNTSRHNNRAIDVTIWIYTPVPCLDWDRRDTLQDDGTRRLQLSDWFDPGRMHSGLRVFLLLLLLHHLLLLHLLMVSSSSSSSVGGGGGGAVACLCATTTPSGGLAVNCSATGLAAVPRDLPPDTAELRLRDNRLTAVPPGALDRLAALRRLWLSGNPFHCDCRIRYLRDWLLRNTAAGGTGGTGAGGTGAGVVVVDGSPTCASPSSLAGREIAGLGEEVFASCGEQQEEEDRGGCAAAGSSPLGRPEPPLLLLLLLLLLLCCVIVLLSWSLRLAKSSAVTLDIVRKHAGLEALPMSSGARRRRRQRLHSAAGSRVSGDSGAPLWTDEARNAS
ncbi:hypothetical protein CRUP_017197, partial [Coryphaenoides rupestris]